MPGINDNEFNLVGGLTDDFLEDKLVSPLPSILAGSGELSLDADLSGEALTPEPSVEGEDEFTQIVLEKGNLLDKEVIVSSTPDNSDSDSLTNYRQDDEVTGLIDIDKDDPLINGGDVSSEGSLGEEPSESETEESDRVSDNLSESSESHNSNRETLSDARDKSLEAEPPTLETNDEAIALDNGGAVSEEESPSEKPSNSNTEEIEGSDNPSESSESDNSDRKTLADDLDEFSEAEPLALEPNDEAIALDHSGAVSKEESHSEKPSNINT
ncbi:hypothetical protein, partial [Laspinema olomoucense]|uniref:hypothetical protein n=1 Tax=Laspinema olomoucense TaxID=3231600 RepID=UPI0021BB54AE